MSSKVFDRDHVHRGSVTALNFAQGLSLKRASINAGAVSAKLPAAVRSVEDLLRRNADAKRILSGEKPLEKRSAWHRVRDATDVGIPDVHTHRIGGAVDDADIDRNRWSASLRLRRHPETVSSVASQLQFRENLRKGRCRASESRAKFEKKFDEFKRQGPTKTTRPHGAAFRNEFQMLGDDVATTSTVVEVREPKDPEPEPDRHRRRKSRPSTAPRAGRRAFVEEPRSAFDTSAPAERPTSAPAVRGPRT